MKTTLTPVLFRTDRKLGDTYAIFPTVPHDVNAHYVTVYQHVGQHSGGHLQGMIASSRPATVEEYSSLKRELERIGYSLRVLVRTPRNAREPLVANLPQPTFTPDAMESAAWQP